MLRVGFEDRSSMLYFLVVSRETFIDQGENLSLRKLCEIEMFHRKIVEIAMVIIYLQTISLNLLHRIEINSNSKL